MEQICGKMSKGTSTRDLVATLTLPFRIMKYGNCGAIFHHSYHQDAIVSLLLIPEETCNQDIHVVTIILSCSYMFIFFNFHVVTQ